jgi:hypothetical protein
MICRICKLKPVTTYGSTVCSLKCASDDNGDDNSLIAIRLKQAIEDAKKNNAKGLRKKK